MRWLPIKETAVDTTLLHYKPITIA